MTLCNPVSCSLPGSSVYGDSPSRNCGVGCHALLQGIFPIQGSNPSLLWFLHWQAGSSPLAPPGCTTVITELSKNNKNSYSFLTMKTRDFLFTLAPCPPSASFSLLLTSSPLLIVKRLACGFSWLHTLYFSSLLILNKSLSLLEKYLTVWFRSTFVSLSCILERKMKVHITQGVF